MLVVLRFAVDDAEEEFVRSAHEALEVLAARPGYLRGQLARAYDDPTVWCLDTEWESVGAYRRALGLEEAVDELQRLSGRQFDGACVDALVGSLGDRGRQLEVA